MNIRISRATTLITARRWMTLFTLCLWLLKAQDAPCQESALTNVIQVLELTPAEAAQGREVQIRGVVTCFDPAARLLFVQDKTAGIYIYEYTVTGASPLRFGQEVVIQGKTGSGRFSPILSPAKIEIINQSGKIQPRPLDPIRLQSGGFDSQFVEMEGIVVQQTNFSGQARLQLANGDRFDAWVMQSFPTPVDNLVDAKVKVRGVVGALYIDSNHPFKFLLYINDASAISIIDQPTLRDWDIPLRSISQLISYSAARRDFHRVRLKGTVTFQWPGNHLFLQDGEKGILVKGNSTHVFKNGEVVEALGFPSRNSGQPVLENSIFQSAGGTNSTVARLLPLTTLPNPTNNFMMVESTGSVINFDSSHPDLVRITLGENGTNVVLSLIVPDGKQQPDYRPGDTIKFQGVSQTLFDPLTQRLLTTVWVDAFHPPLLIFRKAAMLTPRQLQILKTTCFLLGGVAVLLAISLVEIRRRYRLRHERLQAAQDITQENLNSSEMQVRQLIIEREKLSRDLHDEIIQAIYAIGLGLEEFKGRPTTTPEDTRNRVEQVLKSLNLVIRNVRKFIANIEERTLKGRELKTAIKSLLLTLGETKANRIILDIDEDLANNLESGVSIQLLNISKEAIVNSLRHSGAKVITVYLREDKNKTVLGIEDDGQGFIASELSHKGFGLRNMRSRAQELGATFDIESHTGQGTHIRIELPERII